MSTLYTSYVRASVLQGVLIAILFAGSPPAASAQCTDQFLETEDIVLDQSEQLLGPIQSATMLPNGQLAVVTEDPGVFLFDADGSFVRQLGKSGQGPFEYGNPSIVRAHGENIAVWDGGRSVQMRGGDVVSGGTGGMKIIVYGTDGAPVDEFSGITWSVSDFVISDSVVYTYQSGARKPFVRAWDTEVREEVDLSIDEEATIERVALHMQSGSGTLAHYGDHLLFMDPSVSAVQRYDLASETTDRLAIDDPAFRLGALNVDDQDALNADPFAALAFGMESSSSYRTVAADNAILAILKHGRVTYNPPLVQDGRPNPNAELDTFDRYLHVHRLGDAGEAEACEHIDIDPEATQTDAPIVGPTPQGFLYLEQRMNEGDIDYVLRAFSDSK
ncbi:MAG: hypothetical protein PPP56_01580 [Longimonas sp.]|uniref:hypothetical protein n=1 Tax=Longimonas sp. TaxID=2039626 RepID=UPI00335AD7CE